MSRSVKRRLNFDESHLLGLDVPVLRRTYRAYCPMCHLNTTTHDPDNRIVFHESCEKNLHIVQSIWRKKLRLKKLKNITRVLIRTVKDVQPTDIIKLVYEFM